MSNNNNKETIQDARKPEQFSSKRNAVEDDIGPTVATAAKRPRRTRAGVVADVDERVTRGHLTEGVVSSAAVEVDDTAVQVATLAANVEGGGNDDLSSRDISKPDIGNEADASHVVAACDGASEIQPLLQIDKQDDMRGSVMKPNVASIQLDDKELVGCDTDTVKRIQLLAAFSNAELNIVAPDTLPANGVWGRNGPFKNLQNTLCSAPGDTPYTVWIVGRLAKFKFMEDNEFNNAKHVVVNVVPWSVTAYDHMKTFLAKNSLLEAETLPLGGTRGGTSTFEEPVMIHTSTFMNRKGDELVPSFTEVFDARRGFTSKTSMPRLTCWDINLTDTVLVEARITRYRTIQNKNSYAWVAWKTTLSLQAVSLIHKSEKEVDSCPIDDSFTI